MLFEVCIDSVEGALAAQAGGAQRVELCANLVEGGTTPSMGMIRQVRRNISLDVNVIIRPRGGDFCYSGFDYAVMREDIQIAKQAGANGVVLGLLHPDGTVDIERTRALVQLARPMTVTFHRAIDLSRDPAEALEAICELGIERVLTSGGQATALQGLETITALIRQAGERVVIMPGGGITAQDVPAFAQAGAREVHVSARRPVESCMSYRHPGVFMGKAYQPDEYARKDTHPEAVRQVVQSLEMHGR